MSKKKLESAPTKSAAAPVKKTVEAWAAAAKLPPWQFAAAKTMCHWPIGKELTEEEFNQAVAAARSIEIR